MFPCRKCNSMNRVIWVRTTTCEGGDFWNLFWLGSHDAQCNEGRTCTFCNEHYRTVAVQHARTVLGAGAPLTLGKQDFLPKKRICIENVWKMQEQDFVLFDIFQFWLLAATMSYYVFWRAIFRRRTWGNFHFFKQHKPRKHAFQRSCETTGPEAP